MRIAIIGSSGSGKSTLGRRLGAAIGAPWIELDAINWQPGWRPLYSDDPQLFTQRVEAAIAGEAWVVDGNYRRAMTCVLRRATDLIWLDYSRWVIMSRVVRRSVARAWSGDELWPGTGNRENWRHWLDKEHPIRWAWDTLEERRQRYAELMIDPRLAHIRFHRPRRPRDADALVGAWAARKHEQGANPPAKREADGSL